MTYKKKLYAIIEQDVDLHEWHNRPDAAGELVRSSSKKLQ